MVSENPDTGVPVTKTGDDGAVPGAARLTACTYGTDGSGHECQWQRCDDFTTALLHLPVRILTRGKNSGHAITKAGIENIRLDGSNVDTYPFITMEGTTFCWVKGVETYDAGSGAKNSHIESEFSMVRKSGTITSISVGTGQATATTVSRFFMPTRTTR